MPSRNLSATLTNLVNVTGNGNVVFSGSPTIDSPIITTNVGLPTGNTAARPATPSAGNLRFNNELYSFEGYNGTKWGSIGGGLAPTAIKTANNYVAVANDLVRCNTAAGAFSVSFPSSPSDGDIIGVIDIAGTFNTYNLTLLSNSKTIEGDSTSVILDMNGTYVSFVYSSSTSNWKLLETPLGTGLTPTPIKNSLYTASVNDIVRCNTAGGAFTVTLPTNPPDGSLVNIVDSLGTFYTNNLTLVPGGSNTIEGDTSVILDVNSAYESFMYNTTTANWRLLQTPIGSLGNVSSTDYLTGLVKATGLILANATPGTDYLAPNGALGSPISGNLANCTNVSLTTGVSGILSVTNGGTGANTLTGLVKANGVNAFTSASAGTDYLAPPSGTALLKANNSGSLVNASAGTDYVSPSIATTFTKPQTPSTSAETAPSTNAVTWDLTTNQIFRINLNANITTFNLTGTLSNLVGNQYEVIIRYNGGSTVSWNTNMKWTAATAPTLTGTSGKIDVLTFVVASTDGTNYYLVNTGIKLNVG